MQHEETKTHDDAKFEVFASCLGASKMLRVISTEFEPVTDMDKNVKTALLSARSAVDYAIKTLAEQLFKPTKSEHESEQEPSQHY